MAAAGAGARTTPAQLDHPRLRQEDGCSGPLRPQPPPLIGNRRRRPEGPLDRLTAGEREALALIAQGRSNAGVAEVLVITVAAVERHVTSIFDKLDLRQSPEQHRPVLAALTYLKA
jgi:DNA-binding NarL/FixJ family response regulator